ncbi:MAG: metabolite traffic protein EboE [Lentisphaerae bacterium]|nr:metabolite traffic protein EboE [Lentisphaerota bacterium]
MSVELCHCMNVFPGTTPEEKMRAFAGPLAELRQLLPGAATRPFPVGLWIDAATASALHTSGRVSDWTARIRDQGFYARTANAFPYGVFHDQEVKTAVYHPDWSTPERLHFTTAVAEILCALMPDDQEAGAISTLPGGYKEHVPDAKLPLLAENMLAAAAALRELRDRRGKTIRLGFEMEPDCLWESVDDFAAFYQRYIRGHELAEFIGVCYDTCHLEVIGARPGAGLDYLAEQGVPVVKIQLSAALRAPAGRAAKEVLREHFQDRVYMHQTCAVDAAGMPRARWRDLPDALAAEQWEYDWLCHFHVPVYLRDFMGGLQAANAELLAVLDRLRQVPQPQCILEIETYSYHVLPAAVKSTSLAECMRQEMAFVQQALQTR